MSAVEYTRGTLISISHATRILLEMPLGVKVPQETSTDSLGPFVRKVDSAIHRIIIFSTAARTHNLKAFTPGIFSSQRIKSESGFYQLLLWHCFSITVFGVFILQDRHYTGFA